MDKKKISEQVNKIVKININRINKNTISYMMIISFFALIIRLVFLKGEGGDYNSFLAIWCKYLRENGGFKAIKSVETDYNCVYLYFLALFSYIPIRDLYLIKFLSFIFDYVMAFSAFKIISYFKKESKYKNIYAIVAFTGVLFMPTVIKNSARWVQCDSIYTAFIFLSLYYLITKRENLSFILYGIAITFKLQAIFALPIYGIVYLRNREFSIFKFLWIPVANFILYIPALFTGKSILSIFDAYLCQVGKYAYRTVLGYPNIYYFFSVNETSLIKPGIVVTMFILFAILAITLITPGKLNDKDIMQLSVTVLFLVTFFLPEMHDRYGYVAEVLSLIYFIIIKKDWIILIMININAYITYASFLDGVPESVMPFVAISQSVVVIYFTFKFIHNRFRKDKVIEVA